MSETAVRPMVPGTRVLVVGCGSIGQRHARNLAALGVTDLLLYDPSVERRSALARETGGVATASVDDGLARQPTVMFVCSPPSVHLEHARAGAAAGCHVFIEKPLSHSLDGLDSLSQELERRNLVSLVGCNFRFHPGLQEVKRLLDAGELGKVVSVRARFGQYLPDWHPWEDYRQGYSARADLGGGVVLDRIHELDYVTWLVGMPTRVLALVGRLSSLEIETEDVADILLRFPGGVFGTVHLDYVRRSYDCGVEVVGDRGTAMWTFQSHSVRWHRAGDETWSERHWAGYDVNQMYIDEAAHFLRVVDGREPSVCPVNQGRDVLAVALAALRAGRSGQAEAP